MCQEHAWKGTQRDDMTGRIGWGSSGGAFSSIILLAALTAASIVLVSVLSHFVTSVAQGQNRPGVALEAALAKEQVDGDLQAAITAYQKIAGDVAAPRDVRAKALLYLAGCYEKLGKQAQVVYQQIVREFGDQPAAKQAQARLAMLRHPSYPSVPAVIMQRKIEIPGGTFGPQATDGRRMVYRDDTTGDLLYRDAATNTRRTIFKGKLDDLPAWMPARDFSMVALQFEKRPNRPAFVSLIQIDGKGYRELVRDDEQATVLGAEGGMLNWSWDSKFLLMASQEAGKRPPRLLIVSTANGERREMRTEESGHFEWCAFSPDGHFVACSLYPDFGTAGRARILAWPVQGGARHLITEEAPRSSWEADVRTLRFLDWTADGRYLMISSTQSGRSALHLFPIRDGQAAGQPILVRSGRYESGVTIKSGTLVYQAVKPGGFFTVHVAALDVEGRPGKWQKLERTGGRPSWSPDSTRLVYSTWDQESELGNTMIRVHNVITGEDQQIYSGQGFIFCAWAAQQPTIFCSQATDATEILSIAPSGRMERLGRFPTSFVTLGRPSRDDKALYLSKMVNGNDVLVRWEIATGQETVLAESAGSTECCSVSPDERWLWRANGRQAEVRPISGGEWKILRNSYHQTAITADGQWFLYHGRDSSGNHSLLRAAASAPNGTPERLSDYPSPALHGRIEISPDGRQVVTASYDYDHGFELWALENFAPPALRR